MPSNLTSVYPTKVDLWIAILLIGTLALCLGSAGVALFAGERGGWVGAVIILVVTIAIGLIVWPVRYTIHADELEVQSGVWKQRIHLERIRRVYPSRTPLSSPALSMDRLAIEYQGRPYSRPTLYISPVRKEEFLRELGAAAGLEPQGREWIRSSEPSYAPGPERGGTS